MRDGEHSLHLAPQILQASGWEMCALVQIQYKPLVFYVPGSNCHSSKRECEGLLDSPAFRQACKSLSRDAFCPKLLQE